MGKSHRSYDKNKGKPIKNEQWEKNMDLTPKGTNIGWEAFNPRPGKERPTTHVKVNECDH